MPPFNENRITVQIISDTQRKWIGIATRYGLDGPGIESQLGRDFPHPSNRLRYSPSLLENGYPVSFDGVKRPGRGVHHQPLSRAEVKERVQLYQYSLFCTSWPVLRRNSPLPNKNLNYLQRDTHTYNHKPSCILRDIFLAVTYRKIQPINTHTHTHTHTHIYI